MSEPNNILSEAMAAAGERGDQTIQLPPPAKFAPADPFDAPATMLEKFAAALVLALALLLGAAPAGNSDLWLHLAMGRHLAQGDAEIGVEPFTFPSDDVYWVNSSWLFDVIAYGVFATLGGGALVAMKAVLIAAVAAFMILAGRTGRRLWLPVASTCLALVALGPWLALRPICCSYLFLAWTIWFLESKGQESLGQGTKGQPFSRYWPLLAVIAVWANVDRWFFLGPGVVTLYGLGQLLTRRRPEPAVADVAAVKRAYLLLVVASWASCLVNPHLFQVYSAMGILFHSDVAEQLQVDPFLRNHFSPFRDLYFSAELLMSPPSLAFSLLGLLTLISFFLNNAWPWRRGLAWASFALLCLLHTSAIPFFAIVAGIFLARNVGEWLRERLTARADSGRAAGYLAIGRSLLVVGVFGLALAAWPGWLQLGPLGPRALKLEMDPSISAVARDLTALTNDERFTDNPRVFNFSPEAGNFLAWLCPQCKCYVNSHLHLPSAAAAQFVAARAGLSGMVFPGGPKHDWQAKLVQDRIDLVLVHGGDSRPTTAAMGTLFRIDHVIPLLALRGRAALFGWRDPLNPAAPNPFAGLAVDLKQQAFGANAALSAKPADSGLAPASPARWWESFWRSRQIVSLERDEAFTLLTYFDARLNTNAGVQRFQAKQYAEFVVACGSPTLGSPGLGLLPCLHAAPNPALASAFLGDHDDGPVEALYLAVRQARRAIQNAPDEAQNYYLLGETYRRLGRFTRERNWEPILGNVRTCQMLAAYRLASELEPGHWQAHNRLAEVFRSMDYKDLALRHFRASLEGRSLARGESPEQFQNRMRELNKELRVLQREVSGLLDRWAVNSSNLKVTDRADMAGNLGLPGKALEQLLASDIAAFGATGLEMELKLLLNTGQADKANQWLSPQHMNLLQRPTYQMIKAQAEAAVGNYAEAESALGRLVEVKLADQILPPAQLAAFIIGNTLLHEAVMEPMRLLPLPTRFAAASVTLLPGQIYTAVNLLNQQASAQVLQGILAIEAGDNRKAHTVFRGALAFWSSAAGMDISDPRTEAGRQVAQYFVKVLEPSPK